MAPEVLVCSLVISNVSITILKLYVNIIVKNTYVDIVLGIKTLREK